MKSAVIVVCNKAELFAAKRAKVTLLALKRIFNKVKTGDHKIKSIDEHINQQEVKGKVMLIDEAEARNIANENMENELKELLSGGNQ